MSDIDIARKCKIKKITSILKKLNIKDYDLYGEYKAKIDFTKIDGNYGKLILVTAINPTPYGEGKTTVSIGLADALNKLDKNAMLALREPSMGPVFGLKGGATGGGYSQVIPMEDINLHFTGDFHAITSANNLLCAAIDNHLYQGNELNINPDTICFYRTMDMNDRALREIQVGLSSSKEISRSDKFQITAASEIMTILCLSNDYLDLRRRLENILIGYSYDNNPIYAKDLNVVGSMMVLLKEAMKPNLVQSLEHTPCLIHGGPFANIAHGSNSIIATRTALKLADYVVTEAGFGSDLGAEKFLDIKCRNNDISPNCIVVVSTIRALKYNGGAKDINIEDIDSLKRGISNLEIHIENMKKYNVPVVVAINRFSQDTDKEIEVLSNYLDNNMISYAISTAYTDGGNGATELAKCVLSEINNREYKFRVLYDENMSIQTKISIIAHDIYRSANIEYSDLALKQIEEINKLGRNNLPICVAKTQYSLSDDPKSLNAPIGNTLHVREVRLYNGAEYICVLAGNIMTMPGLPKKSAYESIDLINNQIVGLF